MNPLRVNKRSIGVNFSSRGEAEVLVWAPKARTVSVEARTTEKIALKEEAYGYWSCITPALRPGDNYLFELDGTEYHPDPASLCQPAGVYGPSRVVNLHAYQWNDNHWKNIPLHNYILYEIHTGTFSDDGTFSGIEKKLPYLRELGVTALEIMPIAQFPGKRNWGYDGVFPFAVQMSYGGVEGLQKLVDSCHRAGIAVVLDVVYNHLGPEGSVLNRYGDYFTSKYKTPWGDAINFDDAGCDAVRRYFIENALMWLRDFHIDALRLDAVHAIKDLSPFHFLRELREHVDTLQRETGKIFYLIAECDLNDVKFIEPISAGGYGMDAQWLDDFHHALRVTTGNGRVGYYEDFEGILHLAKSMKSGYVFDGIYSPHRGRTFGTKAGHISGQQFVVFSQNHDHVGNRMLGERSSALVSFELQKVMAAAVLLSPYLPMLFMGEEYGELNPFLYFVDHSSPELIDAVRLGRKKEFLSFHHEGEVPDPQSEETFNRSRLNWDRVNDYRHAAMLSFYKTLIALRKNNRALSDYNRQSMEIQVDIHQCVLTLQRSSGPERIVALFNFSDESQQVIVPALAGNCWSLLLDSSACDRGGPSAYSTPVAEKLSINAESVLLYRNSHE